MLLLPIAGHPPNLARPMFAVQIWPGWSRVDPMLCWNTSYSFAFCCLRDRRPIAARPIPGQVKQNWQAKQSIGKVRLEQVHFHCRLQPYGPMADRIFLARQ